MTDDNYFHSSLCFDMISHMKEATISESFIAHRMGVSTSMINKFMKSEGRKMREENAINLAEVYLFIFSDPSSHRNRAFYLTHHPLVDNTIKTIRVQFEFNNWLPYGH